MEIPEASADVEMEGDDEAREYESAIVLHEDKKYYPDADEVRNHKTGLHCILYETVLNLNQ